MTKFSTKRLDPADYRSTDIAGVIGAPLVAAATANSMMAREQVKFLMDFCFQKTDNTYEPVMIRMSITRAVVEPTTGSQTQPTISRIESTFEIPLLTIIPINSLAVESMEVDFMLDITGHIVSDSNESSRTGEDDSNKSVQLMGKVGRPASALPLAGTTEHYEQKSSASLKVHIKSGPLPLPVGITSILNLYVKNLQPVEIAKSNNDNP